MAPKAGIPEGFELLVGRGRENAIKALKIAEERGLDPATVRTSTVLGGFLIPLGDEVDAEEVKTVEAEEIVFPDPEKANYATIDEFAEANHVTYDGIEAENAEKPTEAEKVAHLHKVIEARAAANDEHLAQTGEARTVEESAAGDQSNTDGADGADEEE